MNGPNPDEKYPLAGNQNVQFAKNMVSRSNVEIGDYTYYSAEAGESFAERITDHYEFIGDRLLIGKFNAIASGVMFMMNGANHRMDGSTYPFNIFGNGWEKATPTLAQLPYKGDTVLGNDIWIGRNVTIMPGITIGNGAIIAANTTVVKDVPAFGVVGGNPGTLLKMRFSLEKIATLQELAWWDHPIEKITENLTSILSYDVEALLKNFEKR